MKGIRTICMLAVLSLVAGSRGLGAEEQSPLYLAVVEISDARAAAWRSILDNVENLQDNLLPERTGIELVVHDRGLSLFLKQDNPLGERLRMLAGRGVVLAACRNTMSLWNIQKDDLLPFVITVDSGVAEIVRRQADGWAYLKGGSS
ncbi:MAG: DsrE family protein [Candidatus Competibacteraceae bacterium]